MQWAEKKVKILITHFAVGFVTCSCGERFVPYLKIDGIKLDDIYGNVFIDGTAKKERNWSCKNCYPV